MIFTSLDSQKCNTTTHCFVCEDRLVEGQQLVRDHNHYTGLNHQKLLQYSLLIDYYVLGAFRGLIHGSCNMKLKNSFKIPIFFHAGSGYDLHILIESLSRNIDGKMTVIPMRMEKYLAIIKTLKDSRVSFILLDSYKFLSSSLDNLVSLLDKDRDFEILKKQIHYDEQKFGLLCRKGIMPYDYLDNKEKLKETSLPPREEFYSQLNDENVSNEDYEHAKKVWDLVSTGENKTMLDYLLLYMWLDIILLACVMENFRNLCMSDFGLEPPHYVSLPSLAFDCCLKFTKKNIELFTNSDQQIMVERAIRGGIVQSVYRREQANNKFIENEYDPEKPENYIMY